MRGTHKRIRLIFAVLNCMALLTALLVLLGCGGSVSASTAAGSDTGPGFKLPDLPPAGPMRQVAVASTTTINGNDTAFRSNIANVTDIPPTSLQINVSGGYQWAMYKFNTGGHPLTLLKVNLNEQQGNFHTWVAVTDYPSMIWRWYGPYHAGPAVINLSTRAWANAANDIYFVVLSWGGALVRVDSSEVTVELPSTYEADAKPIFDANCKSCHNSTSTVAPGIVLDNYTDAALVALQAATKVAGGTHPLGGGISAADQATLMNWATTGKALGTALTYNDDTFPDIFSPSCIFCHSSANSGAARHGAPVGIDYDTFALAKASAGIGNSAIQSGSMPPGSPLSAPLKAEMQQWIDDGWPEMHVP